MSRITSRVLPEDVDQMEIYMHQLKDFINSREYPVECEISLRFQLRRIEAFIDCFDQITGGRGTIYYARNKVTFRVYEFGNLSVCHVVTGMSKRGIRNIVVGDRVGRLWDFSTNETFVNKLLIK